MCLRPLQMRGFSERHWADKFQRREQWERPHHELFDNAWAQDPWVLGTWQSRCWSQHRLRGAEADWTGLPDVFNDGSADRSWLCRKKPDHGDEVPDATSRYAGIIQNPLRKRGG